MLRFVVKFFFQLYSRVLSPALHLFAGAHGGCRFEPSCSKYADTALDLHGPIKGLGLALGRILRCNPFSRGGSDPVPFSNPKQNHAIASEVFSGKRG